MGLLKYWRCPQCGAERIYCHHLVIKICRWCQCEMELKEKVIGNGRN